jgi:endonuclease/exonuclease/phosphatase family metal-dependent hydrolase
MFRKLGRFSILYVLLLPACRPIYNFSKPDKPIYTGSYADAKYVFNEEIKVITWNVKFSEEIDEALADLNNVEKLKEADIILLQEMNEEGVDKIAKSLECNYVYYPASIHTHHGKNFGNAILTKMQISDSQKIVLPHQNPKNGQKRIAVRATIVINDYKVLVYSVHTETFWLSSKQRGVQLDYLVNNTGNESKYVIIGGDFNTMTPKSIVNLEKRFGRFGLERALKSADPTVEIGILRFKMDHIFARNMTVLETGVWSETKASDHSPFWAVLSFDR